jgi:hypothetical protein
VRELLGKEIHLTPADDRTHLVAHVRFHRLALRAMHVSELSDEDLAALDAVEIPAETARYNWK